MINVKELKELLSNMPDTAKVYIMADHGQMPESANYVSKTNAEELPYYAEDANWDYKGKKITAIMIS